MPELPEVEYTRRQLRGAMAGARIERVRLHRADLRYPFARDFVRRLQGQEVRRVDRRAKYLLVRLASGDLLVMHLGMSGSFRVERAGRTRRGTRLHHEPGRFEQHDHVVFELSSGAIVVFNDPRRFGFMRVVPAAAGGHADRALDQLGPEPLAASFTATMLGRALARRSTTLKAALLDQRVVAGLGNIYASEALHVAGLSPRRRASTLVARDGTPRPAVAALVDAIRGVLRSAIAAQHRPGGVDRFRVYDREGEPCPRDGCRGVIRRIVQGGRSTFFCPVCQR